MESQEPTTQETTPATRRQPRAYQLGSIFWGLLLILVGGLLLLDNFDIVNVNLANMVSLWPIFLIAAGASMLVLRGWAGLLVALLLGAGIVFAVLAVTFDWLSPGGGTISTKTVEVDKSNQEITETNVTVNGGAGRITIDSDDNISLVKASLDSNFTKLSQRSTITNGRQNVEISLDAGDDWNRGHYRNDLRVTLAESLPMSLRIDAGASDIRADLTRVELRRLTIKTGDSNSEVRLGDKSTVTDVDIDAGVASLTLLVPKSSGLSMQMDSGLSSRDTAGLREVSDGVYESDTYSSAEHKINIRGRIGMSNLDIEYY